MLVESRCSSRFFEPQINLGARFFPDMRLPAHVLAAMKDVGQVDKDNQKISSFLVVWACMAMVLYRHEDVETTFQRCLAILNDGRKFLNVDSKSLNARRKAVGDRLIQRVLERVTGELPSTPTFMGLRVLAIDGCTWSVPASEANAAGFKKSKNQNGSSVYPKFMMLSLITTYDWVIRRFKVYPVNTDEHRSVLDFLDCLTPSDLILMDRGFPSVKLFRELQCRKVHFVARIANNRNAQIVGTATRSGDNIVCIKDRDGERVELRVIEFKIGKEWIRLATSLGDEVGAEKFVWLYHERWQIETVYNMLKNVLGAARHGREDLPIRSHSPALVRQEIQSVVLVFNLLCNERRRAAEAAGLEPKNLSLSRVIGQVRIGFEQGWTGETRRDAIRENCRLPNRRRRLSYVRQARKPYNKFPTVGFRKRGMVTPHLSPTFQTTDRTLLKPPRRDRKAEKERRKQRSEVGSVTVPQRPANRSALSRSSSDSTPRAVQIIPKCPKTLVSTR